MKDRRHVIKIIVFILSFAAVFCGLNFFVQPVWREWNNYDTIHGFYEQPDNTIETVFLGASVTVNGIIPMQLYEDYGICAYNLGTEQQPMLISYYWLQEAYRLHSESLKTVVLDTSMLRRLPWKEFYRKAVDSMEWSSVKYNAVKAYSESINERLSYLIPLFGYHSRWSDLGKSDFKKGSYEAYSYTRGYNFSMELYLDTDTYDKLWVPKSYMSDSAVMEPVEEEAVNYLTKIIEFCESRDIELVLIKTPQYGWLWSEHNTTQAIADSYNIEFIDFNYTPYIDEIDYNCAADNVDSDHMNYYGAVKFTAWLGRYLISECDATDVRGEERFAFLEEELEKYHENITQVVSLKETDNLADYLEEALQLKNCMVFMAVKGDAAQQLTQEQREKFTELGLIRLSELTYRDSYLAVIEDGKVMEEQLQFWDQEAYEKGETVEGTTHISSAGTTKKQNKYIIISGGAMSGNEASCLIDETEYFDNNGGMQIAVYNYEKEAMVDVAVFDTSKTDTRLVVSEASLENALEQGTEYQDLPKELQELYLYERRCENYRITAWLDMNEDEVGMKEFLNAYLGKKGYVIFISAMDDATGALDEDARTIYEKIGLGELSTLGKNDAYIAVVDEGNVLFEQKGEGGTRISTTGIKYEVVSGVEKSEDVSSIKIDGTEYSMAEKGMNIVIYDSLLDTVIDQKVFDTCMTPGDILE